MLDPQKTSSTSKKILFFALLVFMVGFYLYKPYSFANRGIHGVFETLFYLYFFIFNQTLGIVHEAGHGVCYILPCPEFITVFNGTFFQWIFPLLIGLYYKKKGQILGWYTGVFFLGISMHYTAWYIATSNRGPFVKARESFLGVDGLHDFHYILHQIGLLEYYGIISSLVEFIATLTLIWSIFMLFLEAFINTKD